MNGGKRKPYGGSNINNRPVSDSSGRHPIAQQHGALAAEEITSKLTNMKNDSFEYRLKSDIYEDCRNEAQRDLKTWVASALMFCIPAAYVIIQWFISHNP